MDPYKVLGVDVSDSFEVIRSAYLNKARRCHPDKTGNSGTSAEFLRVQQAWIILKKRNESPMTYYKSVSAGSVSFCELQPGDDSLIHPCRCGDVYEVYLEDLRNGYNTFQCGGCSLHITLEDVPDFNDDVKDSAASEETVT